MNFSPFFYSDHRDSGGVAAAVAAESTYFRQENSLHQQPQTAGKRHRALQRRRMVSDAQNTGKRGRRLLYLAAISRQGDGGGHSSGQSLDPQDQMAELSAAAAAGLVGQADFYYLRRQYGGNQSG